ncbi:hypothetical protein [Pseudoalteromonas luteoviolacea]|uniref:hypothetical protein n=1 Tax=Pseudoalteromonas luteoviolacea TaxID=43657 RepID=UPI00114EDB13|nr:hypothetical protein [Pseudoalteromonas luteoviolacea]TQF66199.1 hypothetical protein FLM44_25590 [Pseudoalteromonas luteoviolacea]
MSKNLIIVEPSNKMKKKQRYPSFDCIVKACIECKGDLPLKEMGHSTPDLDSEDETVTWHLSQMLSNKNYKCIFFSESTKAAVIQLFAKTEDIDYSLVQGKTALRVPARNAGHFASTMITNRESNCFTANYIQSPTVGSPIERKVGFVPQDYLIVRRRIEFTARLIVTQRDSSRLFIKHTLFTSYDIAMDASSLQYVTIENIEIQSKPPLTTLTLIQVVSAKLKHQHPVQLEPILDENDVAIYHRTNSTTRSYQAIHSIRVLTVSNGLPLSTTLHTYKNKADTQRDHYPYQSPTTNLYTRDKCAHLMRCIPYKKPNFCGCIAYREDCKNLCKDDYGKLINPTLLSKENRGYVYGRKVFNCASISFLTAKFMHLIE